MGCQPGDDKVRIAVTTIDPDPLISICLNGRNETDVEDRQQSGPERWDYFHRSKELVDRYFLRLEASGRTLDVPVLTALCSIAQSLGWNGFERIEELDRRGYRWNDDESFMPEAAVDPEVFSAAIGSLGASD